MSPADPLETFYRWPAILERRRGVNAHGEVFEGADSGPRWKVRTTSELVVTSDGRQVVTVATLTGAASIRRVPVGSKVTLPARFGSVKGLVAVEGMHDTGIPGVPAFYQIQLERPTTTN